MKRMRARVYGAPMKRVIVLSVLVIGMASCDMVRQIAKPTDAEGEAHQGMSVDGLTRPKVRPSDLDLSAATPPPAAATTAAAFDTVSAEEKAAATAPVAVAGSLGLTVASLGSPSEPGLWMKTPLVSSEMQGRVVYPANGKSVTVTLIPIDGPKTAGSRLSLPAFQVLGAPLTGLPELEVFTVS